MINLNESVYKLQEYIEKNDYTGYDIYDGLKVTNNRFLLNNYFTNTLITQVFKKSPVNFRKIAGIDKTRMPKGMGIILNAYCNLAAEASDEKQKKEYLQKAEYCKNWLLENALKNYSGACWNFGFNYRFMFDKPTVVITSIIAKGLFNYYSLTGCEETKNALLSIRNFILNDLHISKTDYGICFSYTPIKQDCCYNASMLAAETLARIYSISKDENIKDYITKAVDFTIHHQLSDGSWNYSIDLKSGKERPQIDFHQGYVLESLYEIMKLTGENNPEYLTALKSGAEYYYSKQFTDEGRSLWRMPKQYPVDSHFQAQGIITFSLLKEIDERYFPFANKIADWSINNMQDSSGYFYYQVYRFYKNKISYMRWCNAWMFLALSSLLTGIRK